MAAEEIEIAGRLKKIEMNNDFNLYRINYPLYYLIIKFGISHVFLAQYVYPKEWTEALAKDAAMAEKNEGRMEKAKSHTLALTGKLRNRLDGRGKLTDKEHTALIKAMKEVVETMNVEFEKAAAIYRVKKIESLKDSWGDSDE